MNTLIEEALKDMELGRDFESFAGVEVNVGANCKVPDEGWAPMISPREGSSRPGVVLEVGVSESETKLRADAKMWVDPSGGQANIAITIKIKRDRPLLKIDKWEWDADIGRPRVNHHIEITGARGAASVSGEPLLIPFDQIWRRAAQYPRERDIVLNVEDLAFLATHIWGSAAQSQSETSTQFERKAKERPIEACQSHDIHVCILRSDLRYQPNELPSFHSLTSLEEALTLVGARNNSMRHNTTVHNSAIVISINNTDWSRASCRL
ncbi:hypothetical protein ACN38_g4360 [Penicillium nordicum]|uniref:Uncharacterized protein n=1 Tax=Penicillium nordicum TaxID=229535 RepID=A0A0M8P3H7_9EURO|nr:hypothetical protein ACN38_g4360 [Penicillium nordicum]